MQARHGHEGWSDSIPAHRVLVRNAFLAAWKSTADVHLQAPSVTATAFALALGWAEGRLLSIRLAGITEVLGVTCALLISGTQLPEHLLTC